MKAPTQPEVNIGVIGHVDHGKTSLVHALTGEWTDRHSEELKRGISIRLGYADTNVYKCPTCEPPQAYATSETCKHCGGKAEFQRAVSFVDSPGHETLMATMLSGAAIMDGAILLVAANEKCPQPQTKEHLMALSIIGVDRLIVAQNKIDIVPEARAKENHEEIQKFLQGTIAEKAPIVPLSAHHDINIDVLIMLIQQLMPTRQFDAAKPPKMYVARSFDVNVPGTAPEKLRGGVLGGTLLQGKLRVGDEVEIRPGRQAEAGPKAEWQDLTSEVVSLYSGGSPRKEVKPGGLIAVGTQLDPSLSKADSLVGRVAGAPGTLPELQTRFTMNVNLMERVVGTADELKVDAIKTNEPLMISVGTATTVGVVTSARGEVADVALKLPVAAESGQRVAVSRRIGGKWRLIGYGILR